MLLILASAVCFVHESFHGAELKTSTNKSAYSPICGSVISVIFASISSPKKFCERAHSRGFWCFYAGAKETIVLNFRKRDCLTSCSLQTDFITRILPNFTKNSPNASAQRLQTSLQAARLQEVFWADRIRTCGMRAPKARVLPLDDGPIYHKETFSLPYRRFLHDQHYTHPESCLESHF